jgi:hypothetical protein
MLLARLGKIRESRRLYTEIWRKAVDRAISLCDPAEHGQLAMHFGHDHGVAGLAYRAWALWLLGHPEAALGDSDQALSDARQPNRHVDVLL